MHKLLQKLDFKKNYSESDLIEFAKQMFNEKELESIDLSKIHSFFESSICDRIKSAKIIECRYAKMYQSLSSLPCALAA